MTVDTKKLRELANAATPGEWRTRYGRFYGDNVYVVESTDTRIATTGVNEANAEYIAAANPTTVIALLDEIERLRGLLAREAGTSEAYALERDRLKVERDEWSKECHRVAKEKAVMRVRLEEVTAARDELLGIAERLDGGRQDVAARADRDRIAALRKVGAR